MNLVRVGDKKWRGLGVRRIVVMVTDDKTDDKRREMERDKLVDKLRHFRFSEVTFRLWGHGRGRRKSGLWLRRRGMRTSLVWLLWTSLGAR